MQACQWMNAQAGVQRTVLVLLQMARGKILPFRNGQVTVTTLFSIGHLEELLGMLRVLLEKT